MASFSPSYKGSNDFNGGEKVRNHIDSPSATDFNNVVENILILNKDFKMDSVYLHETIADRLSSAEDSVENLKSQVEKFPEVVQSEISETKKKVENLYARTFPEIDVIDSSVSYQRIVPDGALPYAEVAKVGGMSHKSANLIPFPYYSTTVESNGVKIEALEDGGIKCVGTPNANTTFYLVYEGTSQRKPISAGTYTISVTSAGSGAKFIIGVTGVAEYASSVGAPTSITVQADTTFYAKIRVDTGTTVNATFYPMLNEGSTALPYSPYFEGLRHTKVTEIKSIGANLFDFEKHRTSGYKSTFKVVAGATLYRNSQVGNQADWTVYDSTGNSIGTFASLGFTASSPLVLPSNAAYIGTIDLQTDLLKSLYIGYNRDTTFRPYTETSLPIPSAVQNLDGYGLGVDAEYHNYIDWSEKEYYKYCGALDLSRQSFSKYSNDSGQTIWGMDFSSVADLGVCDKYDFVPTTSINSMPERTIQNRGTVIYICDSSISSASEIKGTFIYALATPEVTDISHLLPDDNFIRVEGGGTITAVNEHGLAAPITINYQVD